MNTDERSDFLRVVNDKLHELMAKEGYSRRRAVSAILRQLCQMDDKNDKAQVFLIMKHFSLGSEEARIALLVDRAVRSECTSVGELTQRLQQADLTCEGSSPYRSSGINESSTELTNDSPVSTVDDSRSKPTISINKNIQTTNTSLPLRRLRRGLKKRKLAVLEQGDEANRPRSNSLEEVVETKMVESTETRKRGRSESSCGKRTRSTVEY